MRRAAKVDANQAEIVEALRGIGATVLLLHQVGQGCPDICVGWRYNNWLFEIKTSAGKMTKDETAWHLDWRGQVHVIRSFEDAVSLLEHDSPADAPPF